MTKDPSASRDMHAAVGTSTTVKNKKLCDPYMTSFIPKELVVELNEILFKMYAVRCLCELKAL